MTRMIVTLSRGGDVYRQMALDEAMMYHVMYTGVAIARIYWMTPSAVTIGYFQRVNEAVRLEEALKRGVDVTRRITGGGSVYHDEVREIVYSIVVPEDVVSGDVDESFRLLAYPVTCTLRKLGLTPSFEGLNDVVVEGKKISGNAQVRRGGTILQHGTLLLDVDYEAMEKLLVIPEGKGRGAIRERVGGLRQFGINADRLYVARLMVKCLLELGERLGFEPIEAELPREVTIVSDALVWRYRSREWLLRR